MQDWIALIMQILDSRYNLGNVLLDLSLREFAVYFQLVEERAPCRVLDEEANLPLPFDKLIETDDVGVIQFAHDGRLPHHILLQMGVLQNIRKYFFKSVITPIFLHFEHL